MSGIRLIYLGVLRMIFLDKIGNLFWHFMLLSLLAVGGASSILSELHHYLVESQQWMSNTQFFALYAIAQVSPGPNVQFVTLFGWQVAGWLGAMVSLLGMCGPSSVLAIFFDSISNKYCQANWPIIVRQGLTPVSIGLLFANGWMIASHADASSWHLLVLTGITVFLSSLTRIHPLVLIACGAVAGGLGLLQ